MTTPLTLANQLLALHAQTTQGERFPSDTSALRDFAVIHAPAIAQALVEADKALALSCQDWAEDDTAIKAICAKHGIREDDIPGEFKSAVTCVEELERALVEAEEKLTKAKAECNHYFGCIKEAHAALRTEDSANFFDLVTPIDALLAQLSQKGGAK